MMQSIRFRCPSASLSLKRLLKRTHLMLWTGFVLASGMHLMLTQWHGLREEQKVIKPLTTRFVKRRPRLTKPLEMKKRPRPKQRPMQRQMVSAKARLSRGKASTMVQPIQTLGGLAKPRVEVTRGVGFKEALMEPEAIAALVEGTKDPSDKVDMSLEMMDISALDTGRYHALVIQDPDDKRNIRGFLRLKHACSSRRDALDSRMVRSLIAVVDAMNQYTDIKTTFAGRVGYDSQELLKTPWIFTYLSGTKFEMPAGEKVNLGKYLTSGGFYLLDCPEPNKDLVTPYPANKILFARNLIQHALETQGLMLFRDWNFEILADSHPVFHCYFDFAGAPPYVYDNIYSNRGKLEGVYVLGRWCAILTQKAFKHFWNDPEHPETRSERMVQFGVNTIIFALTQEGSITHRVMDEVR